MPQVIDTDCDGFLSSGDLLSFLRGWHEDAEKEPYLDIVEDGKIDSKDLMEFGRFWVPPDIVSSVEVTPASDTVRVRLAGQLPGSGYCEVGPESITGRVLPGDRAGEYVLGVFLRFGLESCGCPPGPLNQEHLYVPPQGEPVAFDVEANIDATLQEGHYVVEVYANSTEQGVAGEFQVR